MLTAAWREQVKRLKRDVQALAIAIRDPRTPWYARGLALLIVAYALSPLDLIPDPIPILGYLDDLILLPVAILLVLKLIPPDVMVDARDRVAAGDAGTAQNWFVWLGIVLIVLLWAGTAVLMIAAVIRIW